MTATLQTPRLVLRQPNKGDWPIYHAFMDSDRAEFFGSQGDLGKIWKTFASELGHWEMFDQGMWVITRRGDDTCLGIAGPWTPPHWPESEIGWMIFDPSLEGTGIATEAAIATIKHAYDVLGWQTAVSYIHKDNIRSIRLAEKLGAKLDENAPSTGADMLTYRHPVPKGVKL